MGNPVNVTRPHVGDQVHYVSYGTPGGEYRSRCRAAFVTEVGQWLTTQEEQDTPVQRRLVQRFEVDALALAVVNPTGLFFNGAGPVACERDVLPPFDKIVRGERTELRGGTWHWAGEGGCTA